MSSGSDQEEKVFYMIRNIVFDIGNVLAKFAWDDRFRRFTETDEEFERVAAATIRAKEWAEYDRGVLSDEEIIESFVRLDPEIGPVIRKCLESFHGMVAEYDYTVPWIRELREKGYGVYYLSNMPWAALRDCAEDLAFCEETDGGILSCREKLIKPDPAIYRLLLARYGLTAEECVFLDDSEKNVRAARELGMYGIVFRDREQGLRELRELGVRT